MKKRKSRIKGTAALPAYLKGRMDRWRHAVELGGDPLNVRSAFISGKLCRLGEICSERVVELEHDLFAVRVEADVISHQLKDLPKLDEPVGEPPKRPDSVTRSREVRKALTERDEIIKNQERRKEILKRLIEVDNTITKKEMIAREEAEEAAERLRRCFCSYARGALLGPVYQSYLPEIDPSRFFRHYDSEHRSLRDRIRKILDD